MPSIAHATNMIKMNNIEIVRVTPDQIDLLQDISRKTFFEAFKEENTAENMAKYLEEGFALDRLTKELNNPESEFYFATDGAQIGGYMKLNTGQAQTEMKSHNSLEVERIYVLPSFWGKRVGQHLIDVAIARAKCKKVDFVWLGVWEHNDRALSFYRKNGFSEFDKHKFMLGDDEQTDLMMKLPLTT